MKILLKSKDLEIDKQNNDGLTTLFWGFKRILNFYLIKLNDCLLHKHLVSVMKKLFNYCWKKMQMLT